MLYRLAAISSCGCQIYLNGDTLELFSLSVVISKEAFEVLKTRGLLLENTFVISWLLSSRILLTKQPRRLQRPAPEHFDFRALKVKTPVFN